MKIAFVKDHRTRGNKLNNSFFTHNEFKLMNKVLDYHLLDVDPQFLFWEDYTTTDELFTELESHVLITFGEKTSREILDRQNKSDTISKLRGLYYYKNDVFIIPTYNVYKVLISPKKYFDFLDDIGKISKLYNMKTPENYKTNTVIIDNLKDAKKAFNNLTGYLSADIETQGLNYMLDKIIAFGVGNDKKQYIFTKELFENKEFIKELKVFMEDENTKLIWHNGKFDTKFFIYQHGINAKMDHDTMLLSYSIDSRRGIHGLKELTRKLFNVADYDAELKKHIPKGGTFDDVPKDILHEYLGFDVLFTYKLYEYFINKMNERTNKVYYNLFIPANYFLRDVELNGLKPDFNYLQELKKEYTKKLKDIQERLDTIVKEWGFNGEDYMRSTGMKSFKGGKFNVDSVYQLRYVIFDIIGLPHYQRTETTDADARAYWLEYLQIPRKPNPKDFDDKQEYEIALQKYKSDLKVWLNESKINEFIYKFDKYKILKKNYSSYIKGYLDKLYPDKRLHSSFLIHGTETGRLSSTSPNVQNIPRDKKLKNIISVEDGNILIECDYSQAELRVLAELTQDDFLRNVYASGDDLHSRVAEELFGKNFTKEERTKAKGVNFGLAYGRTEYSLALEYDMSIEEAREVIKDWFIKIPTAGKFINKTRLNPIKGIETITPLGRKREFGLITNSNRKNIENEAINTPIQSIASDMTLLSGIELNEWLKQFKVGKIVNIVHDALLIECKPENVDFIVKKTMEIMENVPKKYLNASIPFVADAEVATHWGNKIDWKEGMNYDNCR